jgi:hypothetical protein
METVDSSLIAHSDSLHRKYGPKPSGIGFETSAIILQVFLLARMKSARLVFAHIKP